MTFDVAADAYGKFMGRYSVPLGAEFITLLDPRPGMRALDVGAGTGAATAPLVEVLGAAAVSAVDPSAPFVAHLAERFPGVDVREAGAESLPFEDGAFDLSIAQLVVHFMTDPVAGIAEMARVTAAGGRVAASVWDFAGERAPLSLFYRVARSLDGKAIDESALAGTSAGDLTAVFGAAGLREVREGELTVNVPYASPEDWWQPYTLGAGPAGDYVAGLDPDRREALRRAAIEALGAGPGVVSATAWVAIGVV